MFVHKFQLKLCKILFFFGILSYNIWCIAYSLFLYNVVNVLASDALYLALDRTSWEQSQRLPRNVAAS